MKKLWLVAGTWFGACLFVPSAAQAYLMDPGTCSTDSIIINRMQSPPIDGNGIVYDGVIAATQCFGVNTVGAPANNDDAQGRSSPSPNIGHLGDGFLNGETLSSGPNAGDPDTALDPYLFIDSPGVDDSLSLSQPHDIAGNASVYDPGWIHLARIDGTSGAVSYSDVGTDAQELHVGDLLEISWLCGVGNCGSGTWSLETDPDIVDIVQALLGPNSFDHLAISVFQANKLAVYDFDFTILSQPGNELDGLIDFVTPYSFTGTWNMGDFGQQSSAFSHVNFWARDPLLNSQPLPTPATVALFGLGLLGICFARRRTAKVLPVS